jgi:N-methylhydantoinase A
VPQVKFSPAKATGKKVEQAKIGERRIYFGKEHGTLKCQIYTRELLEPKHDIFGPAVIEQLDTTTVIHPEQEATVDDYRNLVVRKKP